MSNDLSRYEVMILSPLTPVQDSQCLQRQHHHRVMTRLVSLQQRCYCYTAVSFLLFVSLLPWTVPLRTSVWSLIMGQLLKFHSYIQPQLQQAVVAAKCRKVVPVLVRFLVHTAGCSVYSRVVVLLRTCTCHCITFVCGH